MNLPMLPEDPIVLRSAWLSLAFLIAMTGFFLGIVTVLFRTKKMIDQMISAANQNVVDEVHSLKEETRTQLAELNLSNREIANSLHALSAQSRLTQERTRTLETRVDHLEEKNDSLSQSVARLEGRLERNGRKGNSGGMVE